MKNKLTWVLFLGYFVVFLIVCAVFYLRYLDKYLNTGAETITPVTENPEGKIYYSQNNNLYNLNPALTLDPSDISHKRIQSTGSVSKAMLSSNGQYLTYEEKNNLGYYEIWQVEINSNNSLKIATRGQENLNGYLDFINPKFNNSGTEISFIGTSESGFDTIYFKNLASNSYSELMVQPNTKISDYTWTSDDSSIIYCSEFSSSCWKQETIKSQAIKILDMKILQIYTNSSSLIFLAQKDNAYNIFTSSLEGKNIKTLSDVENPRNVSSFQYEHKSGNIVYEVKDNNLTNIYSIKLNGSNKIQLTFDGTSTNPIISPSGNKFAYLKKNDGIYVEDTTTTNPGKISNSWENVILLFWH